MTNTEILQKLNSSEADLIEMPTRPVIVRMTPYNKEKGIYGNMIYINCSTAKRGINISDVTNKDDKYTLLQYKEKHCHLGYSLAYDENLDMLVIFIATFNTDRIMEGETKKWEEIIRVYVNKNKNLFLRDISDKTLPDSDKFHFYEGMGIDYHGFLYANDFLDEISYEYEGARNITPILQSGFLRCEDESFEAVYKCFPKAVALSEGNVGTPLVGFTLLICFLKHRSAHKGTPEQKEIDRLISYGLADFSLYREYIKQKTTVFKRRNNPIQANEHNYICTYSIIERAKCDEPVACIRNVMVDIPTLDITEINRVYLTKDHAVCCKTDNMGGFVHIPLSRNSFAGWDSDLINYNSSIIRGTMMEYTSEIIEKAGSKKGRATWMLLKHPEIERLYKAGYDKYVIKYILNTVGRPEDLLNKFFGPRNQDGKTLYQVFGLNRYQMDLMLDEIGEERSAGQWCSYIATIKCILTRKIHGKYETIDDYISIADVSNKTFKSVFQIFDQISSSPIDMVSKMKLTDLISSICMHISYIWGVNTLLNSINCIMKLFYETTDSIIAFQREGQTAVSSIISSQGNNLDMFYNDIVMYNDYLDMVQQTDSGARCRPYFNEIDEIEHMHNNIMTVFKIKKDKITTDRLKQAVKRVEKFTYKNGSYCVIPPACPDDFTKEGEKLHHCVATYLERVNGGETNIMFIRKTEEPDTPFFTVEISDSGSIEQIHGFNNRNLNTEPDLIPFVDEWQKKCGVVAKNIDKVR